MRILSYLTTNGHAHPNSIGTPDDILGIYSTLHKVKTMSSLKWFFCIIICGCWQANVNSDEVRLLVPERIYAVPGVEANVYYDNIVTVINSRNYVFEVKCEKGRNDARRWCFLPSEKDVGTYSWQVKVISEKGVVVEGISELVVTSTVAGANNRLSVLLIGASQTAAEGYPDRIFELMSRPGNPKFKMIGSNGPNYHKPEINGVAHEGWGGWGWDSFFTRYGLAETRRGDGLHPQRPRNINSRFMFLKDGKYEFDFVEYCRKYNEGQAPDVITVALGLNNIFWANDETIGQVMEKKVFPYLERMIREFNINAPNALIGVAVMGPGASSQDAYGANYGCRQTKWQFRKNLDFYNRAIIAKQREGKLKFELIPMYLNIDGENNFPIRVETVNHENEQQIIRQMNALHPTREGYRQFGDTFYAWLKYHLANGQKSSENIKVINFKSMQMEQKNADIQLSDN